MTYEERTELQENLRRMRRALSDLCDVLNERQGPDGTHKETAIAHAYICAAFWSFERWSKQQDENDRMKPRP